nr:c-type cytochrome synthesis 1 [Chlamydomonas reinhardtii]
MQPYASVSGRCLSRPDALHVIPFGRPLQAIAGRRFVRCFAKGGQPGDKKKLNVTDKLRLGNTPPTLDVLKAPRPTDAPSAIDDAPSTSGLGLGGGVASPRTLVQSNAVQVAWRRLMKELSSLPRAIAIMALIAVLSGLGTFIPQNKSIEYYLVNYPDGAEKVLGFLTGDLILTLQLDHIYTADYFYLSMGLLAASLAACTYTRQWPAVKVAQRWRFLTQPKSLLKQGRTEVLPNARVSDLGAILLQRGYQVFVKDGSLYNFKGLAGKLGPIGVHAALLLCLFGTAWSGFGTLKGNVMCPEGQDFQVASFLQPSSPIASMPASASNVIHVNKFTIDYRPDGSVAQFYSDLSLLDPAQGGKEMMRKTISVNDPFRFNGVTMYQTDWSLSAVTLRVLGQDAPLARAAQAAEAQAAASTSGPTSSASSTSDALPQQRTAFNLPMASLEGKPGVAGRLWATFLPLAEPGQDGSAPKGISILARDPQSVVFYDAKGQFVGVRRPGSGKPIEVEGLALVVEDVTGATGLELKSDPGVPAVYAGFGGLMVTTLISYLSHSQVWALQQGSSLFVSGRTNRAKLAFDRELDDILNAVPELPPTAATTVASSASTAAPAPTAKQ